MRWLALLVIVGSTARADRHILEIQPDSPNLPTAELERCLASDSAAVTLTVKLTVDAAGTHVISPEATTPSLRCMKASLERVRFDKATSLALVWHTRTLTLEKLEWSGSAKVSTRSAVEKLLPVFEACLDPHRDAKLAIEVRTDGTVVVTAAEAVRACVEAGKPTLPRGNPGKLSLGFGWAASLEEYAGTLTGVSDDKDLDGAMNKRRPPGGVASPVTPRGRISVSEKKTNDDTTLTPDVVLAKILSAYVAGVKRCYRAGLEKDPALRGKLALSFEVTATGRAKVRSVTGVSKDVEACVAAGMAAWRFPIAKDGRGDPTTAGFEFVLQLVPD